MNDVGDMSVFFNGRIYKIGAEVVCVAKDSPFYNMRGFISDIVRDDIEDEEQGETFSLVVDFDIPLLEAERTAKAKEIKQYLKDNPDMVFSLDEDGDFTEFDESVIDEENDTVFFSFSLPIEYMKPIREKAYKNIYLVKYGYKNGDVACAKKWSYFDGSEANDKANELSLTFQATEDYKKWQDDDNFYSEAGDGLWRCGISKNQCIRVEIEVVPFYVRSEDKNDIFVSVLENDMRDNWKLMVLAFREKGYITERECRHYIEEYEKYLTPEEVFSCDTIVSSETENYILNLLNRVTSENRRVAETQNIEKNGG